jgi:hypothetical protein
MSIQSHFGRIALFVIRGGEKDAIVAKLAHSNLPLGCGGGTHPQQHCKLRRLTVGKGTISFSDFSVLCQALEGNCTLTTLTVLSITPLSKKQGLMLARALRSNIGLKTVSILKASDWMGFGHRPCKFPKFNTGARCYPKFASSPPSMHWDCRVCV